MTDPVTADARLSDETAPFLIEAELRALTEKLMRIPIDRRIHRVRAVTASPHFHGSVGNG